MNDEDLETCANCGQSLAPGSSLLAVRRETAKQAEAIDIPPPKQPSAIPAVLALGAAAVVAAGIGLFLALRTDPCGGKVTSDRFDHSYCVALPAGWQSQPSAIGDRAVVDGYYDPQGVSTVLVVGFDLQDGTSLDAYAAAVRQADQQAGQKPGRARPTTLGGVQAQTWDIVTRNALGEEFRTREVVAVVGGNVGWTVELTDTAEGFDAHLPAFARILSSWHFK